MLGPEKNLTFLLIFRNLVPNFKEKRYNLYRLSHMALQPTMVISQHRLPNATSSRAVAHAVTLNPVFIFIPDHRIILSNNQVGTYRLGQKEKVRLIELEKSHLHGNL
ncbi:hypothetical protein LHEH8_15940 [Lactobacillus helveticus]|uniref:Methylated-DNA-[protein]-cysteine S-methyltransferase DNA binding domain-containing protein n=1 Tax=Lactobacillus helveticus TaxID=1587 RepID=A0A8H9FA21_LACHE|nr:hypothetical protein LHEH8_15940 [Lactobacillus helveticus]GFP01872.1 hypothetical protein LHEW6_17050 [Lactobacillus helveticus]GFP02404.1 hypothetical protein LHEY10_03330 [Lactobacillus helveticus]GFP04644.1 hypothetical protein LMG22465_06570 [Lactobacillus helveticus]